MKKRFEAGLLLIIFILMLMPPGAFASESTDALEYEPDNIILDVSNSLSWKNPTSDKLESVRVYMISDSGEETDVSEKLTATTAAGVATTAATPSAIVFLPDAADSTTKACNCRLVFKFSDGTVRNIIWGDEYRNTALFIQASHSSTENPNNPGTYINVDVWSNNAPATAMLSNSVIQSGERSLRVESNNVYNKHFQVMFGGLVSGTTYNVSMWINTVEEVKYDFHGVEKTLPNTNGEWQSISLEYTTTDGTFGIKPIGASREAYFDDITFTPKGEEESVLTMGFETHTVTPMSDVESSDVYVGDRTVKLKWAKQPEGTVYINVYEKLEGDILAIRARIKRPYSEGTILSDLENDVEHTFIIKNQNDNNNWGYGLESDGLTVTATPHFYSDKLGIAQTLEGWAEELAALVEECNSQGLYPSYETADASLVNVYAKKLISSYESLIYDDFEKYKAEVEVIYNEAKDKLSAVLGGTRKAVTVSEYEISSNEIKGGSLITKSPDGQEKQRVEIGFSGFYANDNDIADMSSVGIRAIQHDGLEKGPTHLLNYDEDLQDYVIDEERAAEEMAELRTTLELCRSKGVMVDGGICLHYCEDVSSKAGATDFRSSGGSYGTFINFNPTAPTAKKMIKKYFEVIIPVLYEYKDIMSSFTFVNEPYFEAWDKSYYYDEWTAFLTEKYKNIEALNDVYDAEYASIDDVKMPEYIPGRDENDTEQWTTPLHMDYRLFVTDIMYEFFEFCINEIDKYTNGEVPCGVKTMQFFREYHAKWKDSYCREISYDYEKVSELFDYNGMDSFSYYNKTDKSREKSITLPAKLSWYDFTTSVKNAPIIETEAHVAVDLMSGDEEMDDTEILSDYMSASVWMGAIHGADFTATWFYSDDERASGEKHNMKNTIFLRRPDALKKMSHTALDARRLSDEINALQNAKRKTAILYSYECFMYNLQYQSNMFEAYEMLTQKGQMPLFVTESSLDKLSDCRLLIIPGNLITTEAMVNTLSDYVSGGGRLIFIGSDCFSRDKNNKVITDISLLSKIEAIKNKATVISANISDDTAKADFSEDAADEIEAILEELGLMSVKLTDKATGETAQTEWTVAEYNGETVISACNYSDEAVTVKIEKDGEIRTGIDDIKNMEYNLSEVVLEPYEPVLLKLPDKRMDMSLLNSSDEEVYMVDKGSAYKAVLTLANYGSSEAVSARMLAAVYKDNTLINIYMSEQISVIQGTAQINNIPVPDTQNGNYSIKLILWDGLDSCKPLTGAKTFYE